MKRVLVLSVSALLSLSLAAVVMAQVPALDVRMGLWEMSSTTQFGGQMPAIDTSKMSPEQRAKVEASMKNMVAPQTKVSKSCVTKEKLEKSVFMMEDQPGQSCKQNITTNTRSVLEAAVSCTGEYPVTGQMHIDALSPTSIKGTVKSASTRGGTMNVNITMTGKWLGADCGSEK